MAKGDRYQVPAGQSATVELSEEAVFAKAIGDVAWQVRRAVDTLKRLPLPREVSGMAKTTASIYAAMAAQVENTKRRRPPSSAAIDQVDAVIECLLKVEPIETRNLLVVRGLGLKWDAVIEELGLDCSRWTVKRMHDEALVKMLCAMLDRDAKKACSHSPK